MKKNKIFKNSFYLIILNVVNVISPLMVLPYLSRVLGINNYGVLMYILSVSAIFWIFTDFGFNLYGVYYTSKNRKNKNKLGKFIGAVYKIKFVLVCLAVFFLIIFINSTSFLFLSTELIFLVCINIFIQTFFLNWLFQGLEKMSLITLTSSIAKFIYVLLTFIFIKNESDVAIVMLLYCTSNIIIALMSVFIALRLGVIISFKARRLFNKTVFFSSAKFFYSRIAVSLYTSASAFLIGTFLGPQSVALYSSAEKIYQAAQSFTGVLSQVFFPFMVKEKNTNLLFKLSLLLGSSLFVICSVMFIYSEEIISTVYGNAFTDASHVFRLFLVVIVVNFFNVSYGYPLFASINKLDIVNKSVIFGSSIYVLIISYFWLKDSITIENVSFAILIVESIVLLTRLVLYKRLSRKISV